MIQNSNIFSSILLASLIHSLWIGGLIYCCFGLLLRFLRAKNSEIKYLISVSSLFVFIASMAAIIIFKILPYHNQSSVQSLSLMLNSSETQELIANYSEARPEAVNWSLALMLLYFAGVSFISFRMIFSFLTIKRKIRTGESIPDRYIELFESLKNKLKISQYIRLISSDSISSPALFGFIKPIIIVPSGILSNLSFEQVELILMHELIHVKRLDFLINLTQHLLEILFFFNPFIWLLSKEIREERERSCDSHVLEHCSSPQEYAKALLNISLLENSSQSLMLGFAGTNKNQLLNRIYRILNIDIMKKSKKTKAQFATVLLSGLAIILVLSAFSSSFFSIERNKYKEVHDSIVLDEKGTDQADISITESTFAPTINSLMPNIDVASIPDTIPQEMEYLEKEAIEEALEELKSIDWDKKFLEIQEFQEQNLSELHDKMIEQQLRIHKELMKIDEDLIKKQMEIAMQQLDSIKENIDIQEFKEEFERNRHELEEKLKEKKFSNQEIIMQMEETFEELKDLDFDMMLEEFSMSIENMDFDFDFDFDYEFNLDSTIENAKINIESIDMEAIKVDVERTIQELETQLKEIKEREKQENLNN